MSRSRTVSAASPRARALAAAFERLAGPVRRALRALWSAPPAIRALAVAIAMLVLWGAANWIVQTVRKPSEMFFPVGGALVKSPELLAALAQIEGAGNPVARPRWSWRPSWNPFELYRPSSSAVGMFQITDAAFRDAKRYCIHDHAVVVDGPWYDPASCWFNGLYTRVVPSHAIEMTSALLDRRVANMLARSAATLQQKQDLAAVIHLCGPARGRAYVRGGFQPSGPRCGTHDLAGYLAQVNALKRLFARLAAAD